MAAARTSGPWYRRAPSFFEAATVIAFLAMERAGVEVAVVEVGMGGRLDSTNVVVPDVSVITNVAMDHAQYLGNDLETIAAEKAGIIKAGVPVVTGVTDAGGSGRAGAAGTGGRGAAPRRCSAAACRRSTRPARPWTWTPSGAACPCECRCRPSPGDEPGGGSAGAGAASAGAAAGPGGGGGGRRGDSLARPPPGRESGRTTWILDVAHNAAGVESLLAALPDLARHRDRWWRSSGCWVTRNGVGCCRPCSSTPTR
jgi:hypothetical protein